MNTLNKYILFLDLDGVLVNFEYGVEKIFKKKIDELSPRQMWPRIARTPDFYDRLEWMPDGQTLWEFCAPYFPVILTGVPMGKWAAPQKQAWCARELGPEVEVITCRSKEKATVAHHRDPQRIPVLVDDRENLRASFEALGGIFVHHQSAEESIARLTRLGF